MYSHRNRTFWSWCVMCAAILAAMTVGGCEATETPVRAVFLITGTKSTSIH